MGGDGGGILIPHSCTWLWLTNAGECGPGVATNMQETGIVVVDLCEESKVQFGFVGKQVVH